MMARLTRLACLPRPAVAFGHPHVGLLTVAAAALLVAWNAAGCSDGTALQTRARSDVPARSYTVLGVIEAMPRPERPGTQLIILHEEIPDFVAADGRVGMKKMAMPFPLGPGVRVDALSVGDPVTVEFTVDWNATPAYWITAITRRPFESPATQR